MSRLFSSALVLSCLCVAASACSNNNTSALGTTTPTSPLTTITFNGTLTPNGAVTHPFQAAAAGSVTATLTTLAPPDSSALSVSLSLGTWNGSVCQTILSADTAVQGTVIQGNVSTTSNLCVRISDAAGTVPGPTPYLITVSHP